MDRIRECQEVLRVSNEFFAVDFRKELPTLNSHCFGHGTEYVFTYLKCSFKPEDYFETAVVV